MLAALGVVYGDIGTSPIYTMNILFSRAAGLPASTENLLGVLSLIFWSLLLVVGVKYMLLVLKADHDGDGGVIALATLLDQGGRRRKGSAFLLLGVVASALLIGDGMLTPAISVLSAVQGLEMLSPVLGEVVPEITILILIALFAMQHRGTAAIGALFGPVMLVWFLVLALTGLVWVLDTPRVLAALDPRHAVRFFMDNGWTGFVLLGTVFLVVTGSEALYADLGHFGRAPIRRSWIVLVWPALVLNYLGQGALLLGMPTHPGNSFFALVPPGWLPALILLAALTTAIASQAIISGLFSLFRQLGELDYYPNLGIRHTSARQQGQIYIASVNWLIMAGSLGLVLVFRTTDGLANAYGLAIGGVTLITSILFLAYQYRVCGHGWVPIAMLGLLLLGVDLAFLTALLTKLFSGAQVVLVISGLFLFLMLTWRWGQRRVQQRNQLFTPELTEFITRPEVQSAERVSGTAIFLSRTPRHVPRSLLHNFLHNHALHRETYVLQVKIEETPRTRLEEKFTVDNLGSGFFGAVLRLGYMELPRLESILTFLRESPYPPSSARPSLFLSRARIDLSSVSPWVRWRGRLYAFMQRNAPSPATLLEAPPEQVIEIGIRHEL